MLPGPVGFDLQNQPLRDWTLEVVSAFVVEECYVVRARSHFDAQEEAKRRFRERYGGGELKVTLSQVAKTDGH